MKPTEFPEQTIVLRKPASMTDEECSPLAIFQDPSGTCVSRWELSWRERLAVLFGAPVWLGVLSGRTQPPVWLMAKRTCLERIEPPARSWWRFWR